MQRLARRIATARIDAQSQRERMVLGKHALSHQGCGDRHRQQLSQLFDLIGRPCRQGSTTGVEDGQSRLHQEVCSPLDVLRVRRGFARWSDRIILQGSVRPLGAQHIPWHLQHHWTGRAEAQGREGPAHDTRDIIYSSKKPLPLHQTIENTARHLLLVLFSEVAQGVLPHEEQDGDIVSVACGDARQSIGCPWARASHGHTHSPRRTGVAVSNFHAEAFVTCGEDANRV